MNNCDCWNVYRFSCLYLNLRKKTGNRFKKKFLHKCLFKIPLWRKIDNITYYFLISSINLKAIYLSFHWFNDSWTRGFEFVTRGFELVTRGFELVLSSFQLVSCNSCFTISQYFLTDLPVLSPCSTFSASWAFYS